MRHAKEEAKLEWRRRLRRKGSEEAREGLTLLSYNCFPCEAILTAPREAGSGQVLECTEFWRCFWIEKSVKGLRKILI